MKKLIQKFRDGTIKEMLDELCWMQRYSKQYSWAIAWYVFVGIISSIVGLIASVLSKNIIDIVTGFQYGQILWVAITYVAMKLSQIGMTALANYMSTRVNITINQRMRADVFGKIMHAQWEEVSRFHSGDLLTRIGHDTEAVASGMVGLLPSLVVNIIQFVSTFLLMMYYDQIMALLALTSAPVVFLVSGFFAKRVRKHSKELRQISSEMTSFYGESFQNIQIIKSFGVVDSYSKKLEQTHGKQRKAMLDHNRFSIGTSSFLSVIGMVVGGVCFFWGVYRLWEQQITYGEMTLLLQLSGGLSSAFGSLVSIAPALITTATAAGRVMEVTELIAEENIELDEVERIINSGKCAVQLKVEDMDFSYLLGNCVFRQAELQAEPGQIVALVGPSGGGKTTMLRILLGIVKAEKGIVQVSDEDSSIVLPVSPATRRLFSYVPQGNTLFSGTIADNLTIMKPDATQEEIKEVLRIACAEKFVNELPDGIYTCIGEKGNGLSEGQIQRLSIARALLSKSPVLLLDEATSALDVKTERTILKNIISYQRNRTCIVTTHRPSVLEICQRVYQIDDETVVQISHKDVEHIIMDFVN